MDEAIYFTSDGAVVDSFRTKFDDLWLDESRYADYANVSLPRTRHYGIYPKDPATFFLFESFATTSNARSWTSSSTASRTSGTPMP